MLSVSDGWKFDFFNQPAAVVLSDIERTQEYSGMFPSMMSIHGPMIVAMCSNMFRVALNLRFVGSSHLHALPFEE